jgi:Fe-S cluster biogenesis protein NfuA
VTDAEARALAARLEERLEALEGLPPAAREAATGTVATMLDLYGEALARIAARVPADALVGDEVVAHLLIVHDLHPVPVGERVEAALDEVRPYLRSHGGEVALVEVRDGAVRLRLQGSCSGCPASRTTLELAVADAIRRAAPEVEEIHADDAEAPAPAPAFAACPAPIASGGAA